MGRRSAWCGAITLIVGLAMASAASAVPATWSARISIAPHALNAVSCPSPSLCLAIGDRGEAVSSTSPAGGAAMWTATTIDGGHRLISLSCPSTIFCAATDNASAVVTSSDPGGGAAAWSAHTIDPGRWIVAISCASSRLCVAVDRHGGVLSSTRPADPHGRWSRIEIRHGGFVGVSCPSTRLCVVADFRGRMWVSTNPTGGRRSWRARTVIPNTALLLGVSCAKFDACMLVDSENGTDIAFRPSRHPTGPGIWRPDGDVTGYPHEGVANGAVTCVTRSFCAGISHSDFSFGDGWVTTDFGRHWHHVPLNDSPTGDDLLRAIACGGTSLCVAVDNGGGAIVGS